MNRAFPQDAVRTIQTPAKINLILRVLGIRPDGFHDLESVVCGIGLFDTLRSTHNRENGADLVCSSAELETDSNLVTRASRAFVQHDPDCQPLRFQLDKRIPIAAGLGGGSSNAAGALMLHASYSSTQFKPDELSKIGAGVGSDVPLFFFMPCALIRGRGEIVTAMSLSWCGWFVLIHVDVSVSTPTVFKIWDDLNSDGSLEANAQIDFDHRLFFDFQGAAELSRMSVNDLEPAVYLAAPEMKEARERLCSLGYPQARVTGAGSVFYLMFDERAEAERAAVHLQSSASQWAVSVQPRLERAPTVQKE